MSSNQRVRELRKDLSLTQKEFGEKIGLKQAVIGQMEKGARNLTDRTIILICEKFNVNEEWLRHGIGPMFLENDESLISELAVQYHLGDLDKSILKIFLELSPEKREVFKDFLFAMVKSVLEDPSLAGEYHAMHADDEPIQIAAMGGGVSSISKEQFEEDLITDKPHTSLEE